MEVIRNYGPSPYVLGGAQELGTTHAAAQTVIVNQEPAASSNQPAPAPTPTETRQVPFSKAGELNDLGGGNDPDDGNDDGNGKDNGGGLEPNPRGVTVHLPLSRRCLNRHLRRRRQQPTPTVRQTTAPETTTEADHATEVASGKLTR